MSMIEAKVTGGGSGVGVEGHLPEEEAFEQKRPSCVIQEEGTVSAKPLRSEQAELFEGPKG